MSKLIKRSVGVLGATLAGFYVLGVLICAVMAAAFSSHGAGLTFGLTLVVGLVPFVVAAYLLDRRSQPLRAPAIIQNNQNKVLLGAIVVYGLLALVVYLTDV